MLDWTQHVKTGTTCQIWSSVLALEPCAGSEPMCCFYGYVPDLTLHTSSRATCWVQPYVLPQELHTKSKIMHQVQGGSSMWLQSQCHSPRLTSQSQAHHTILGAACSPGGSSWVWNQYVALEQGCQSKKCFLTDILQALYGKKTFLLICFY